MTELMALALTVALAVGLVLTFAGALNGYAAEQDQQAVPDDPNDLYAPSTSIASVWEDLVEPPRWRWSDLDTQAMPVIAPRNLDGVLTGRQRPWRSYYPPIPAQPTPLWLAVKLPADPMRVFRVRTLTRAAA